MSNRNDSPAGGAARSRILDAFASCYVAHLGLAFQEWSDVRRLAEEHCAGDPAGLARLGGDLWRHVDRRHPEAARLPHSGPHRRRVERWVSSWADPGGNDVGEDDDEEEEPDYVFKTYYPGARAVTLLEENRDPLSQGTTGLVSWQGALALAAWADTFGTSVLAGRDVLELGSGAGLLGLALAASDPDSRPRSFAFTDCHPKVLQFLRFNASLNFGKVQDEISSESIAASSLI